MSDKGGGSRRRNKNQEMAKDLVRRGIYHGYRWAPWYQGINWPSLSDVGAAKARRRRSNKRGSPGVLA